VDKTNGPVSHMETGPFFVFLVETGDEIRTRDILLGSPMFTSSDSNVSN